MRVMRQRGSSSSRLTLGLWVAVAYLALLYVAFRWGGSGVESILPSAD